MLVIRWGCRLAVAGLLLHVLRLCRHAKGIHPSGRGTSHATWARLLSLLVGRGVLVVLSLRREARALGSVERSVLSGNELPSALLTQGAGTTRTVRFVGRHLREKACLGQLGRVWSGRVTHFGCTAAPGDNCGAHVLAGRPCDVSPASSDRARRVFPGSVGRRNSSVRWQLDEMKI